MSAALTKSDVAAELRVSTKTVSRLIERGEIQSFRVGRQVRVRDVDLRRFVAERVGTKAPKRYGTFEPHRAEGVGGRLWD